MVARVPIVLGTNGLLQQLQASDTLAGGATTLTGDVTGSGTGSFTTTISATAVTLAKLNSEVLARMMTMTSLRI